MILSSKGHISDHELHSVLAIHVICTHTQLETCYSFCNSQAKHDMEMKLASIDFSRQVVKHFRSP